MKTAKDIWVFMETASETIRNVSLELLTPGRQLADQSGAVLTAVVIGYQTAEYISAIERFPVDRIIVIDDITYRQYETEAYAGAMEFLIRKYQPAGLLIGATKTGRDFAPRLSCRLDTGLTADCTGISVDQESGLIAWTRPTFGGKLMATIVCDTSPQIGTVRPGVFRKPEEKRGNAEVIREKIVSSKTERQVEILECIPHIKDDVDDLEQAEIIVAAGRGIKDAAGVALIKDLADELNGSYGSTRALIDQGMMDYDRLIGQTGKSVAPKVYFACGISGALQHTIGLSESSFIVAVNSDPEAPIFDIANVGIVGDVYEVLPIIIKALKEHREKMNCKEGDYHGEVSRGIDL